MNYDFAVLEQNIRKERRQLAKLVSTEPQDYMALDWQRGKLDSLYKKRRKQALDLSIVRFFENNPQELYR